MHINEQRCHTVTIGALKSSGRSWSPNQHPPTPELQQGAKDRTPGASPPDGSNWAAAWPVWRRPESAQRTDTENPPLTGRIAIRSTNSRGGIWQTDSLPAEPRVIPSSLIHCVFTRTICRPAPAADSALDPAIPNLPFAIQLKQTTSLPCPPWTRAQSLAFYSIPSHSRPRSPSLRPDTTARPGTRPRDHTPSLDRDPRLFSSCPDFFYPSTNTKPFLTGRPLRPQPRHV
jgi:hypothetical protein